MASFRERHDGWQADYYLKGLGRQRKQGFPTKEEAEQYVAAAVAAHEAALQQRTEESKPEPRKYSGPAPAKPRTLQEVGEEEAVRNMHWSSGSYRAVRGMLNRIYDYFGADRQIHTISEEEIVAFRDYLISTWNISLVTWSRYRSVLSPVWRRALVTGAIRQMPDIPKGEQSKPRQETFDEELFVEVEKGLRELGYAAVADAAVVLLGTGMRPGELWALTAGDLREVRVAGDAGARQRVLMAHILKSKNGDQREVPVLGRAKDILLKRKEGCRNGDVLFPGVDNYVTARAMRRVKDHLGLQDRKELVLYTTRHTAATRMADEGVEAWTLAAVLGHRGITTAANYVKKAKVRTTNVNVMRALGGLVK